jgi:hypothetical protein
MKGGEIMTNKISNATLLADVKRVMKATKSTSRSAYRAKGNHASETVERRFKGWTKAVKRASK